MKERERICFESGRENMLLPFAMLSYVFSAKALFTEPFRNRMFKNKYSLYRINDSIKWQLFKIFIVNRKRVNEFRIYGKGTVFTNLL